ncbi:MAG: aldo/keto reductase [Victivallales bacterium]|nr:aldo/keto reductase [Victivallales bacterium]
MSKSCVLNNGIEMPVFGLGVYQSLGECCVRAVRHALDTGYRHVDTASFYGNEREVGKAVRESGLPRDDIFVVTKLWNSDHGYDRALKAFGKSHDLLGIGVVDLYLIHWPVTEGRKESWRALETIYQEGRARSIGVSNYTVEHLEELLKHAKVPPAVNQVEFHPWLFQKKLLEFCRANNIMLVAYSPLTKGERLNDPELAEIAARYSKTPAQILLRWILQHDMGVIPKSSNPRRIEENADVFDFDLSMSDMALLDSFDRSYHCTWDPTGEP